MELAQPAVFGKGAGCELVKDTCDAFIKQTPAQNYYCPAEQKDGERLQVTAITMCMQQRNGSAAYLQLDVHRTVSYYE
jgi:hypothetical protein